MDEPVITDSVTRITRPCLGMTDIFFPDDDEINWKFMKPIVVGVCNGCVNKDSCAHDAMVRKEKYGFWGGQHWSELKRKKRKLYNLNRERQRETSENVDAGGPLESAGGSDEVIL